MAKHLKIVVGLKKIYLFKVESGFLSNKSPPVKIMKIQA